jgi:hypothetical protein
MWFSAIPLERSPVNAGDRLQVSELSRADAFTVGSRIKLAIIGFDQDMANVFDFGKADNFVAPTVRPHHGDFVLHLQLRSWIEPEHKHLLTNSVSGLYPPCRTRERCT